MKTHYPKIKKDPHYQEALLKVYQNNPELVESQQKSNAEKRQRLNAIKINKIALNIVVLPQFGFPASAILIPIPIYLLERVNSNATICICQFLR